MKGIWMLLTLLVLSACVPVEVAPQLSGNPMIDAAVANAQLTSTVQARIDQEAQATEQAAKDANKTENEIKRVMAPVQAEQTRTALQITAAAAQIEQARAQVAQTATVQAYQREQIRISAQERQEANAAAFDSVWRWGKPVISVVLFLAIGLAFAAGLYFLPHRWLNHQIAMQRQKGSIVVLPGGCVGYFGPNGLEMLGVSTLTAPGDRIRSLPDLGSTQALWGDGSQPEAVNASATVLKSKPRISDNTPTGKALALVQQAIRISGPFVDKIPRWEGMGFTSNQWQYATGILEANGLIEKTPTGTFLKEEGQYANLNELEIALRNGLTLKPIARASPSLSWAGD